MTPFDRRISFRFLAAFLLFAAAALAARADTAMQTLQLKVASHPHKVKAGDKVTGLPKK